MTFGRPNGASVLHGQAADGVPASLGGGVAMRSTPTGEIAGAADEFAAAYSAVSERVKAGGPAWKPAPCQCPACVPQFRRDPAR
jgi:hypothetical protein